MIFYLEHASAEKIRRHAFFLPFERVGRIAVDGRNPAPPGM